MTRFTLYLAVTACILAMAGCPGADKGAKVSGTVTFKGKVVPGGTVIFQSEDGEKQDAANIESNGTYVATHVPLGKVNIGVQPAPKGPTANMPKDAKKMGKIEIPADNPISETYSKRGAEYVDIPMKLRDPRTSNINTTVDGDKTFDINLPGK